MRKPVQRIVIALSIAALLAACGSQSQIDERAASAGLHDDTKPAAEQFAAVSSPAAAPSRVFGSYTRGCVTGAQPLPSDSPHWQILNPSRNRAWGHPALIRFIEGLADRVARDGHRGLLIGDLAQPRGGPLPSDHNSHQVGLDADIWLTPIPRQRLTASELETFEPPSMIDGQTLTILPNLFGAAQVAMLKHAAEAQEVERIFVSPPIKQALCDRLAPADRAWLRKIRPWRGHTAHMHVRLTCPPDSEDCASQEPPPEGNGCGAELASWFAERSWTNESSTPYKPEAAIKLDALPAACRRLLTDRG